MSNSSMSRSTTTTTMTTMTTTTNANYSLRVARQPGQPLTEIRVGDLVFGGEDPSPVIIAGPCSVEDEAQLMRVALGVKATGAQMLRGGAFKPRTSPYAFRGLGEEGLRLLDYARAATGLPIVTEVMTVADVDLVAQYADVLQIGARNMQHFALLEAVGARTQKPILLKRGIAATVDEWLMAAEYILAAGNPNVILCERGIRTYETSTRFTLDLGGMLAAQERTHLPVIADPSHAAGQRRYVAPLARAALAAGAAGLLVEVHDAPEHALSDGDQALTLDDFAHLMHALDIATTTTVAVRGATSVAKNTKTSIAHATRELLDALVTQNVLDTRDVTCAIFTMTDDLNADYPARIARTMGFGAAALLDTSSSVAVPHAPKRILRALLFVHLRRERPLTSVYLHEARDLRTQIDALLGNELESATLHAASRRIERHERNPQRGRQRALATPRAQARNTA